MPTILWHIEVSHYNEKARWALDYKGIPYELRVPMPGLHGIRALVLTRGAQRRLPVLQLDGRRIGDSTAIIAALEAHTPDPALYPADPAQRDRALELEDFFDERSPPSCGASCGITRCPTSRRRSTASSAARPRCANGCCA